jgi:hypothetical protein
MSYVPGENSSNPIIHFKAGMKDLFRFDQVRLINIFGSILYGFIYIVLFLIIGVFLHYLFPQLTKKESLSSLFFWILFQSVVIIVILFYCRKFVEAIPGPITFYPEYLEQLKEKGFILYGIDEYKGDMATSIVFIGTQYRLLEKIAFFIYKFSKTYFM